MFPANSKKPSMNNNSLESQQQQQPPAPPHQVCVVQSDSGLVLTTDPKPRLRWTVELHQRFVDAVNQLGGSDKATPKTIMKVMGIKGLTLYHLKSHLQKYRLGKQPHNSKEVNDHSLKDAAAALELQRNVGSVSAMTNRSINDNLMAADAVQMQMEVRRRLHEQLEVQRHLQLRIEAEGKYMESILARACRTLCAQGMDSQGVSDFAAIKNLNYCSSIGSLSAPRDLQQVLSGSSVQVDHLQHHTMDSTSLEGFLLSHQDNLCGTAVGKKRYPYSNPNEPNLLDNYWDLSQVPQLGLEEESPKSTSDQLEVAPSLMDAGIIGMKSSSMVDAYESKLMSSIIAKEEEGQEQDDDYDNDYSAGRRRRTIKEAMEQYYQSLIGSHGSY